MDPAPPFGFALTSVVSRARAVRGAAWRAARRTCRVAPDLVELGAGGRGRAATCCGHRRSSERPSSPCTHKRARATPRRALESLVESVHAAAPRRPLGNLGPPTTSWLRGPRTTQRSATDLSAPCDVGCVQGGEACRRRRASPSAPSLRGAALVGRACDAPCSLLVRHHGSHHPWAP